MTDDRITATRIGIVTDSNSQITPELAERFGVRVIPLTVTVDGVDYAEGVDLDADAFYAHFAEGRTPVVATSQPSPGLFAAAYAELAGDGCTEIVSIHIGEAMSGTIGSANIAAAGAPVPVHLVDTGSASFGVSACVWAAAAAIAGGAEPDGARAAVAGIVPRIGTAFMIGVPALTERGGRAAGVELDGDGVPVLVMSGGRLDVLARVSTVDDTVDVMASYAAGWGDHVTVAIGVADEPSRDLADRLRNAVEGLPQVDGVVEYRVGPSVGAHTGPGTFGLFVFPTPG